MEYFLSNYQKRFKRSKKHVRNLALDQVDQGVSCSTRAKIDINIVNDKMLSRKPEFMWKRHKEQYFDPTERLLWSLKGCPERTLLLLV